MILENLALKNLLDIIPLIRNDGENVDRRLVALYERNSAVLQQNIQSVDEIHDENQVSNVDEQWMPCGEMYAACSRRAALYAACIFFQNWSSYIILQELI